MKICVCVTFPICQALGRAQHEHFIILSLIAAFRGDSAAIPISYMGSWSRLSLLKVSVPSLARELRSCKRYSMAQKKEERFRINNLTFYLKTQEKKGRGENGTESNRRKEIKARAEINESD